MTDIASISLRVDTGDLQRGNNELDKFQETAAGAAVAADGFNKSGKGTAAVSKEVAREVEETHKRVAEYNRRLRETQATATTSGRAQDQLTESYFRQIDRIKQLGTGMQELRTVQSRVRADRAAGNITQSDYLALVSQTAAKEKELAQAERVAAIAKEAYLQKLRDQVELQGKTASQMQEYRAAQLGVTEQAAPLISRLREQENAWKRGEISASQYRMAMRQLPMQITDVVTSLASGMPIYMVAIQQGGQIKDSFGGIGNTMKALRSLITPTTVAFTGFAAVIGGIAYAAYSADSELRKLETSLTLTGNYAAKNAGQLLDLADSISAATGATVGSTRSLLAELARTGIYTNSELERVGKTTSAWVKQTDESASSVTAYFKQIADDPVQGLAKLNEQFNFLSVSQLKYVKKLEDTKGKTAAVTEATNLFADVMDQRLSTLAETATPLQKMWDNIKRWSSEAWAEVSTGFLAGTNLLVDVVAGTVEQISILLKQGDLLISEFVNSAYETVKNVPGMQSLFGGLAGDNKAFIEETKRQIAELDKSLSERDKRISRGEAGYREDMRKSAEASKAYSEKQKDEVRKLADELKKKGSGKGIRVSAGDKAEDSGQAELLALQAQLKMLQEHRGINDKISQQRKDLWKAQAQFSVLEDAAGKRQLSAQEKSLLASKDKVLALAEQKAALGDQIVQQERLNKLQDTSTKYVTQMSEKRQALRESAGLGDREARRRMEEAQLAQGWQNQGGSLGDDGYKRQLKAAREFYAEEDKLRSDWLAGGQKGWNDYLDSATNVYSSVANVATSAFTGLSDVLTSLATTGSANVKAFGVSMLKMVADIINRLLVAYAVQAAMGWISSASSASSGGNNPGSVPMGLYDSGGYTGDGGKHEPKGIVHGGEFVFTKEATRNIGVGNLYAMMHSAQGYADGGYVGNAPMHGLAAAGGGITVDLSGMQIITQGQQEQPASKASNELVSKAVRQEVIGIVSQQLDRALGQSGRINQFVTNKIGR